MLSPHRVPSDKYVIEHDISIVTDELLNIYHTRKEVKKFYEWMNGQTMMLRDNGTAGYYTWDYERWLAKKPIID